MRLVMLYTFGDGCSWSAETTFPVVCESPEQALCDFEESYAAAKKGDGKFLFGDNEFFCWQFECEGEFYAPDFMTVDEWFNGV